MSTPRLRVLIVGAGIGGLATGAMLREYADVTILESVPQLKEVGAALSLGPGGIGILRKFGIHLEHEGGVVPENFIMWGPDGEQIVKNSYNAKAKFGEDIISIHRADLQAALYKAATKDDGPGAPCTIMLNHNVVSVDPDGGIVTVEDGTHFSADVVVGADGIRSTIRRFIVGDGVGPQPAGESAYRLLIRQEDLQAIDHGLLENGVITKTVHMVKGPQRKIIAYPVRGCQLLNLAAFVPDSELHEEVTDKWTSKGSVESMVKSHETFGPYWKDVLSCGKEVGVWQMRDMDPLETWVKGRSIIIGDAAHPMLPHQAAGALCAIEDAEALSAFLQGAGRKNVHEALQHVFRVRYKRTSICQAASRREALSAPINKTYGEDVLQLWLYPGAERWERERPDMVLGD